MSKKNELIEMVSNLDELETYKKLERLVNDDKSLKKRISEMKSIQKQLVNAKTIGKNNAIQQFENEYETVKRSIEEIPKVDIYLDLQNEINELLKEIKEIIEFEVNKELENSKF